MCYWKPDIWCNWCSWTWRSLERSRGYEFEIRICSNKRQWLVHDFRTFRNSSERIKNEHLRTRNVPNGWERTSRGIKIIEILNGLKPRSLFKGAASGYELILEMFILNIKKVHHQIRNHIRYQVGPKPKKVKQGRNLRKINSRKTTYFLTNFGWKIFYRFEPKISVKWPSFNAISAYPWSRRWYEFLEMV